MLLFSACYPQPEKLAIVVPRYLDKRSNTKIRALRTMAGGLLVAMTSGSLVSTAVFAQAGLFEEKFFIDWVDYDYCLGVRDHGWIIEECQSAILLHQRATPVVQEFWVSKSWPPIIARFGAITERAMSSGCFAGMHASISGSVFTWSLRR